MKDSKSYLYVIKPDDNKSQITFDIIMEFKRCLSIPKNTYRIIEKWSSNGEYLISFEYFNMWIEKGKK